MPTLTGNKALDDAKWEYRNNPSKVTVRDPEMGNESIDVDVLLLIAPDDYSDYLNNRRLRKLAIEQGAFKPAPGKIEE